MALDLSLPERPERRGPGVVPVLTLLLVIAVLAVVVLLRPGKAAAPGAVATAELAGELERRGLFTEAAAAWEEVAARGEGGAEALFRAGRNRLLAGEAARAVRDHLAAEARGLPAELKAQSDRDVVEALAVLGKFDARDRELKRRTDGAPAEADVVAKVGEEAITREELSAAVRDEEAMRLFSSGSYSAKALDDAVSARLADPASLARVLEALLVRRLLSLQALAQGLAEKPEVLGRLAEARRDLLSQALLRARLDEGLVLSEADLRDHHAANRDLYTEPEAVRYSAGEDAAALAEVDGWHRRGDPFPGADPSSEADAALFALGPGETTDRAISLGGKALYLSAIEKRPARPLPFEEAKDRVTQDLARRRQAEVMQALRGEIEAKHPVTITDDKLRAALEGKGGGGK